MFLFFPYGTAEKPRRQPMATLGVILFTLAVTGVAWLGQAPVAEILDRWGYIPNEAAPATFVSSIFLHREIWRLALNMWLLFLFGPLIEGRIGHIAFLLLYLGGGLAASAVSGALDVGSDRSLAHVGSSGALAAIFGVFLVLYPFNDIKVWYASALIYWGFKIGTTRIMGMLIILLWFFVTLLQLYLDYLSGNRTTDLTAQLAGFVFGAIAASFAFGKEGLRRETSYGD